MCGIAGVIVKEGGDYNPLFFKLISLYQDSRGGDSAGVGYITTEGIELVKGCPYEEPVIFKNLFKEVLTEEFDYPDVATLCELFTRHVNPKESFQGAALAHSRKTTIGGINIENTHPFVFAHTETNKKILGCHNGTVRNYKELAKIIGMPEGLVTSDSKVLLWATAQGQLEKIYWSIAGGATIVWAEEDDPFTLNIICTGNAAVNTPDRTLYYLMADNCVFLSSEMNPLSVVKSLINSPNKEKRLGPIYRFDIDVWYKLKVDSLTAHKKFLPLKPSVTTSSTTSTSGTGLHEKAKQVLAADIDPEVEDIVYYHYGIYWLNGERLNTIYRKVNGDIVLEDNYLFTALGGVVTKIKNKYYLVRKDKLVDLNPDKVTIYKMFFVEGVLLRDEQAFMDLVTLYKQFRYAGLNALRDYIFQPIPSALYSIPNVNSGYFLGSYLRPTMPVEFTPVFSTKTLVFNHNLVIKIENIRRAAALKKWKPVLEENFRHELSTA